MKKVFFFDIDGTLIDCRININKPSELTKKALQTLIDKGHEVIICTGRSKDVLPLCIAKLPHTGFVGSNGSYVEYKGKTIYQSFVGPKTTDMFFDFVRESNTTCEAERSDRTIFYESVKGDVVKVMSKYQIEFDNFIEYDKNAKDRYTNMFMWMHYNKKDLLETINERFPILYMVSDFSYQSNDVVIKGTNKGIGVKKIIKYLNLDYKNTYCFGDGANDIEMLQSVCHPIGMGKIHEDLLPFAKDRCGTVKEDGIYNKLVELKII